MAPIEERRENLGAEFVEADCYTCRTRIGPKLIYKYFEGYGTGKEPDKEYITEAYDISKLHDKSHTIVIFIGHG